MYNTFIHQRRLNEQKQHQQYLRRESNWHKRYQTQVQPFLLEHYDKRLTSFIHKIEQKPMVINPQNILIEQDKKNKSLIFRNAQDWKSVFNIRQRNEIKLHQSFLSQKSMKQTDKIMPSIYSGHMRTQYRIRSKQKQINPPMRYCNAIKKQTQQMKLNKNKKNTIKQYIRAQRMKQRQRKMSDSQSQKININQNSFNSSHNNSFNGSKHYDEDLGDLLRLDSIDNIEIQARLYQKQRQIVQKKLHFKKLLQLSIKNPLENKRKDYKKILQRCGLLKYKKSPLKSQTTQLDKFSTIIESSQKLRQK